MARLLYEITWEEGTPSIESVCERYGLSLEDLDSSFGVISIDPWENLYCVMIEQTAMEKLGGATVKSSDIKGPFSNPMIGPFGPAEK
ncbi:MAG: hypothetical protein OEZ32_02030 [Nitrospinota bacterium]|nr:hypothetical protein [Nitrospinota bacterium]